VEPGDGAMVGSYLVSVSKTIGGASVASGPVSYDSGSKEGMDAAYKSYEAEKKAGEAQAQDLLPAKYKDPNTSGLNAEVTKGGDNDFTFELTQ
jgi:hypothetical protein